MISLQYNKSVHSHSTTNWWIHSIGTTGVPRNKPRGLSLAWAAIIIITRYKRDQENAQVSGLHSTRNVKCNDDTSQLTKWGCMPTGCLLNGLLGVAKLSTPTFKGHYDHFLWRFNRKHFNFIKNTRIFIFIFLYVFTNGSYNGFNSILVCLHDWPTTLHTRLQLFLVL